MADGISIVRDGHKTWLKWHRARKTGTDLPFTGERILEGLRLGASVEVDLVRHADGGFAVLHDFVLDHDTTGAGRVSATSADALRKLFFRDGSGRPTTSHPMLFEDLCALIAAGGEIAPEAVLQLDLKEDAAALDDRVVESFARAVGPIAGHFILSGGHPAAIARLADAAPGLAIGFDPCHEGTIDRLAKTRDFTRFVADAVTPFPRAEMIYLEHRLVLFGEKHDFDLVGAFHAEGKRIDAYTLNAANRKTAAIAETLLAFRVDQITTDDPVGLESLLIR
jgi:glycerophosphoryl diester phosphodiesterase